MVQRAVVASEHRGDGGGNSAAGPAAGRGGSPRGAGAVPPACFSIDRSGCITGWTYAAEDLVGWSAAHANGRRADDLLLEPSSWVSYHAELAVLKHIARPAGWLRVHVNQRDGTHLPVDLALTRVDDDDDIEAHVVMRRAADSLAGPEIGQGYGLTRSVLDALPGVDGVVACDAGGHLWLMTGVLEDIFGPVEGRAEDGSWSLRVAALRHGNGHVMLRHQLPLVRVLRGEVFADYPFVVDPVGGAPRRAFLTAGGPFTDETGRGALVTAREVPVDG